MKNAIQSACLFFIYVFASCSFSRNEVSLRVDIPIEGHKIVSVFSLSNGTQVYEDTLRGEIVLDSLSYGIHLLTVMWDRDIISPDEFRRLRPHSLDDPSYYSLQKRVFIDPREGGTIRLYTVDDVTQGAIEELLLSGENVFTPSIELSGTQAQLYETYESILASYRQLFRRERDSLKHLMYRYNDEGNLQQAKVINKELQTLWANSILPRLEDEEKQFLIKHAEQIIVPFILQQRVTNAEQYNNYKAVIEAMPTKYRKLDFF